MIGRVVYHAVDVGADQNGVELANVDIVDIHILRIHLVDVVVFGLKVYEYFQCVRQIVLSVCDYEEGVLIKVESLCVEHLDIEIQKREEPGSHDLVDVESRLFVQCVEPGPVYAGLHLNEF